MLGQLKAASLVTIIGLVGCGAPQTLYDQYQAGIPLRAFAYKAGVGWSEIDRDKTNCEIEAAQRVPQNISVQTSPSYSTPTQTYCNQIGTQTLCNTTGGQTYGGQTTSSDANAGLRVRAYAQCMAGKNYRFVDIPACSAGTDLSSQNNETVLRPLSRTTCYQASPSGGYAIGDG